MTSISEIVAGLTTVRERRWIELRSEIIADARTDIERETLERCLPMLIPLPPDYEER